MFSLKKSSVFSFSLNFVKFSAVEEDNKIPRCRMPFQATKKSEKSRLCCLVFCSYPIALVISYECLLFHIIMIMRRIIVKYTSGK